MVGVVVVVVVVGKGNRNRGKRDKSPVNKDIAKVIMKHLRCWQGGRSKAQSNGLSWGREDCQRICVYIYLYIVSSVVGMFDRVSLFVWVCVCVFVECV